MSFSDLRRTNQKRNPVIRSMSDRRNKEKSINEVSDFKDTMALKHKKLQPMSSQKIFQTQKVLRPSCPPPNLPDSNQNIPLRPPRHQSIYLFASIFEFTFIVQFNS